MAEPDVTKLPIPTTWPEDGGPFITLPLVVTADPNTGVHNMGMYRVKFSALRRLDCIGSVTSMELTTLPILVTTECLLQSVLEGHLN